MSRVRHFARDVREQIKGFFLNGVYFLFLSTLFSPNVLAVEEKHTAWETTKRRQKTEIDNFLLQDPKQASLPQSPIAIELYNDAVTYYQSRDYDLAEEALKEAMSYDPRNPFAPQLMGDLYYLKHDLALAKEYYKKAYLLHPDEMLKEKIEKINREIPLESKFSTLGEETEGEKFILKYQNERNLTDVSGVGVMSPGDMKKILNESYQVLSDDFGHAIRGSLIVLLYDPEEFRTILDVPHWIGGLNDGKVRLPAYGRNMNQDGARSLVLHEMTHSFVHSMSGGRGHAPEWLNEGLAVYQEGKMRPRDLIVLKAAIITGTLFPLDRLMAEGIDQFEEDPLLVSLFYEQSFHVVDFLIKKYGMFKLKELVAQFKERKTSEEALTQVIGLRIDQLEALWKNTLTAE